VVSLDRQFYGPICAQASEGSESADTMRILLVNDESVIREIFGAMISHAGHELEFASDGNEALKKYRDCGPYDLVLTDLLHPGPDGLEILRIIQQQNPSQRAGIMTAVQAELPVTVPLLRIPCEREALIAFVSNFDS
jgi:CheY-like chemotaxis protein